MEEMQSTLPDIVANLSLPVDHKSVGRFNISRANVWDGAVRGFKHTTYSETCDMLVRFTDDAGVFEEGIDTGGQRQEFLTLLMKHLKDQPIFDGPEGHWLLVYNANGMHYYYCYSFLAIGIISPLAFTMAMEIIIRASKWVVGGERRQDVMRLTPIRAYMDDMTLVTTTVPCMKRIIERLNKNLKWAGMKIKPTKS